MLESHVGFLSYNLTQGISYTLFEAYLGINTILIIFLLLIFSIFLNLNFPDNI